MLYSYTYYIHFSGFHATLNSLGFKDTITTIVIGDRAGLHNGESTYPEIRPY